jgi:hypothetical protein
MRTEFSVVRIALGHGIAARHIEACGAGYRWPEGKKIPATCCRRELMVDSFFVSQKR